jgi:hypothetical protein
MAFYNKDGKLEFFTREETFEIVRCSAYLASRLASYRKDQNNIFNAIDVLNAKKSYDESLPEGTEDGMRESLRAEFHNLDELIKKAGDLIKIHRGTK